MQKNTVLFNRTNSPELVGKTAIYLGEQKAIFAGYLIRINNFGILDSHYLNYSLNTNYAKAFCNQVKSDGVSQSNINAQKLGKFEISFPPLEEQREIVRQVDKLFAFADKLEDHYRKAKEKVAKFPQSVPAKAFRGELVPQWPDLPAPQPGKYWVYVVKCENDTNYIGQTSNLRNRWSEHLEGEGSDWTKRYSPHYVMYWERCDSREHALKREKE